MPACDDALVAAAVQAACAAQAPSRTVAAVAAAPVDASAPPIPRQMVRPSAPGRMDASAGDAEQVHKLRQARPAKQQRRRLKHRGGAVAADAPLGATITEQVVKLLHLLRLWYAFTRGSGHSGHKAAV